MERIGSIDGLFSDGNPSTGTKGTIVTAAWLNALQEAVIALAGDVKVISANYTLLETDGVVLIDTTAVPVTLSLPAYASVTATKQYRYKWIAGENAFTIDCSDAKTIDEEASIAIEATGDRGVIIKDGTNWQTI